MDRKRRTLAALSTVLLLAGFTSADSKLTERQRAIHALNRLGFGARPGDVERVMKLGVDRWIAQQLHPESINDAAVEQKLARYDTLKMSNSDIAENFVNPLFEMRRARKQSADGEEEQQMAMRLPREQRPQRLVMELSAQKLIRSTESERQLNEVMVDFWFNHFNVFAGKGLDRFLLTSYERDTIRPHVWGKFEDLLRATAKSPAMLFYLDNAQSVAAPENRTQMRGPRGARREMPEMQRARGGINENYAREIMELHTLGVDGGYTQKDVTELARVFTGWSMTRPNEGDVQFVFRSRMHDSGAKTVLGVKFPAGGGQGEGEKMIHVLAHHPATARHIATQLCQRLVSDNPPKALVDRVAKRFLDTDGDLRETVAAAISSPEFWSPDSYRAKVKSPFEYVASAIRASGATVVDPVPTVRELQKLGEPLYGAQPPTGYDDRAASWTSSGALVGRLNFAIALTSGKLPGVRFDASSLGDASVDALAQRLTGGDLSNETKSTLKKSSTDPITTAGLILGSPEFQRQ